MATVVVERGVGTGSVTEEKRSKSRKLDGEFVTPSSVTGHLGLSGMESKEWTTFLEGDSDLLCCPILQMRFRVGQRLLLVWYRDTATRMFHLQFVKYGVTIPDTWEDVEVYQGRDDALGQPGWKDRVLEFIRRRIVATPTTPKQPVKPALSTSAAETPSRKPESRIDIYSRKARMAVNFRRPN